MEAIKTDLKEILLSNFRTAEQQLNGKNGGALAEKRKEAISIFDKLGFPTIKNEEWKYTNLSPVLKKEFALQSTSSLTKKEIEALLYKNIDADYLVFINGNYSKELSKISNDSALSIQSFAETDQQLLERHFSKGFSVNDAFTHLNTAFASAGFVIRIAKGKSAAKPLMLYFIADGQAQNVLSQPRILVIAEENSQIQLVESFHSLGENTSLTNAVTEIVIQKDAHVDYYKIQNESAYANHVGTTQVLQEGKSYFSATTVTLNGNMVRNNLNIVLNAEYSEATMYGLTLINGTQHVDNHTIVDHAKPNCYSNELYKSILADKSTGVFNGKIFVKQDAQKTNAFQSNKSILLSKDASMNTKPQLEIFADDVKCSHGATIGQLDEEPLFYLRSRGINENKAKALLVMAFAQDVLDHIKIEPLREALLNVISQRLGQ